LTLRRYLVDVEEYQAVIDRALYGMLTVARELGPDRVNARPAVPGSNSAFAILTHCLGVCEYWVGALIAGRAVDRDREAEFEATGTLEQLAQDVAAGRARLQDDLACYRSGQPPAVRPDPRFQGPDEEGLHQDGVLLHVLEELTQHHGQLQVLRDVLLAAER
jgi:cystathionine beta-lyase